MKPLSCVRRTPMLGLLALAAACSRPDEGLLQGYVEGEFVFVASPHAGQLLQLAVQRGGAVERGDLLFVLEDTTERAAVERQGGLVDHGKSQLADEQKGLRPSEIASLTAQLEQARAALQLAEIEFRRLDEVVPTGAAAVNDLDRARAVLQRDTQRVAELEADLQTARLGAREDRIAATAADVRALEAELARTSWDLEQKRQNAPATARVFDTLYREGEWVQAGMAVVVLLPPANVKVRAFVPEPRIGAIHVGDAATVRIDGVPDEQHGTVTFVSPRAEYTPPVIYSYESRQKLVFMIEIRFADETAALLHPGQPVDVRIGTR